MTRRQRQRGGQTPVPICIYSHSDYFDVLQINLDYMKKLFKDSPEQKLYLFVNEPFEGAPDLTYETILYDDTTPYMARLVECIQYIPSEYFILCHDIDIILRYKSEVINRLVPLMKKHMIDSIDLKHDENTDSEVKVTDSLSIVKVQPNNPLIFCVQPRLWLKEAALNLFTDNSDKTYRGAESREVQQYVKKNQNTYEFYAKNSIKSYYFGVDRVSPNFVFIHSTHANKFFPKPLPENDIDPFILKEIDYIQKNYIDTPNATREQWKSDPYDN